MLISSIGPIPLQNDFLGGGAHLHGRRRCFAARYLRPGYLALPMTPSAYQSKSPIFSPPKDWPAGMRTAPALSVTGPVNGLKPCSTWSAEAVTSFCTSGDTPAPNGATAIIWPSPSRTIAGLNVPFITLFAVSVMNGPQVKPSPVIQYFGASCLASIDWNPIEYFPRLSAAWMMVAGESQ